MTAPLWFFMASIFGIFSIFLIALELPHHLTELRKITHLDRQ